jgi:hypothetical protein
MSVPVAQALGLSRSLNVRLPEELPERLQQAVRSSRNAANAATATRPSVSSSRVVPPGRDSLLREMRGSQMASAWEEVLSPQQQRQQQQRQRGRPGEELELEEEAAYQREEAGRHIRAFASPSGNPGSRGRAAHADAAARHRSASVGHVLRMRGSPPRDAYARDAGEAAEEAPAAAGYAYSYVGQQAADLSPHRVRSTSVPSQRRPSDSAGRPAAGGSKGRQHTHEAAGTAARVMAALDGVRTASAVATTAGGASAASPLVKALSRLSEEIHAAENRRLGREAPPYNTELQPAAAAALRAGRTDLVGGSSAPQPSPGTRGSVRMTVTVTSRGQSAAGTPAPRRAAATGSEGPLADLGRPHRRQHSDDLSTQASVHSYDSERDGETDKRAASSGAGAMPTRLPAPLAALPAPAAPVAAPLVLASNDTRATASQIPAPVALAAVQTAAAAAVVKPAVDGSNQELMVDIAALQAELSMLAQIGQEAEEAEAAVDGKGPSKTFVGPAAASVPHPAPVL